MMGSVHIKPCPRCQTEIKLFTLPEGAMTDPAPPKARLFVVKRCPKCGKKTITVSELEHDILAALNILGSLPALCFRSPETNEAISVVVLDTEMASTVNFFYEIL